MRTTHQLLAGTSPSHAWTLLAVALLCLFGSSCLANPSGDAAATVTQAISLDNEEIGLGGVGIELGSTITPAQLADLAAALAALSADVDDGFEDCEEIEQVLAACGITVPTEDESQRDGSTMACAAPADPDRVQLDAAIIAAQATLNTAQADVARLQAAVDAGVGNRTDLGVATVKAANATAALGRLKVQRDQLLPAQQALKINPNDKAALLKLAEANEAIARLNLTAATAARWAAEGARNREAEMFRRGASTAPIVAQMDVLYEEARQKEIAALLVVANATAISIAAAK